MIWDSTKTRCLDIEHFVKLRIETWEGPYRSSEERDKPTVGDMEAAIGRLDGRVCTEVTVEQEVPWAHIGISGGPDLYLVTGEMSDEKILQLTSPDAGDDAVPLVCGGQLANFARRDLVSRDRAIEVAARFLAQGDYDPELAWDIQE